MSLLGHVVVVVALYNVGNNLVVVAVRWYGKLTQLIQKTTYLSPRLYYPDGGIQRSTVEKEFVHWTGNALKRYHHPLRPD